ncbi:homoprotocatechuate degradation operon regulator HpaR [Ignatzschineria rhizosphaerae]|uniref:Homoprotocatechuate degradation operon regulator HpaR n=1 Tax=Ignatzschineria rhizosphaerae TaxID=2923279 RepID=A0ABY3WYN9_9GAMM|nr:homoprotocatechuate degradation operon regulator HpaR [Ignatzschineria rhizosphaerae]UNM95728.1 homoprotocatechuate degradation operon regulator HpaR [Ignatzschineria rhizosphaerae]
MTTQKNIPLLLMRVRELMMRNFRPILNEWNLTEQQWRILRALYETKTLEPRELCEICCILSPSMAGILKRMEELELIIKVPSKTDKRRVLVELSPGVDVMVRKILEANMKAYDAFAAQIGENLLSNIEENLVQVLEKNAELEKSAG